jgi:hypothetical protein
VKFIGFVRTGYKKKLGRQGQPLHQIQAACMYNQKTHNISIQYYKVVTLAANKQHSDRWALMYTGSKVSTDHKT